MKRSKENAMDKAVDYWCMHKIEKLLNRNCWKIAIKCKCVFKVKQSLGMALKASGMTSAETVMLLSAILWAPSGQSL